MLNFGQEEQHNQVEEEDGEWEDDGEDDLEKGLNRIFHEKPQKQELYNYFERENTEHLFKSDTPSLLTKRLFPHYDDSMKYLNMVYDACETDYRNEFNKR